MSIFPQSGNQSNIFVNQTNVSTDKPQSGASFSIGTNNQNKLGGGIFDQNITGSKSVFTQNTNTNNFGNTSLNTPTKSNNMGLNTSNIFGNNQNNTLLNNSQNSSKNILGNNTNNQTNPINNTVTSGTTSIFPATTNSNIFPNNTNSNIANQNINNIFNLNSNQNNQQTGVLFNQAAQNQTTTNQSEITNSLFGNNVNSTNQPNQFANTVTTNTNQNNQQLGFFNNNPTSSQPNQLNKTTNTLLLNTNNNPQTQPNSTNNLFGNSNQSTLQNNLNNSSFFTTNPNNDQNKGEINILPARTQPKTDMFSNLNQSKPQDNPINTTGNLFQSSNAGGVFGNQVKSNNPIADGMPSSLTSVTTNKNLFADLSNVSKSASLEKPQFITAPTNILGINLDTLSESVKKAYKSENKSIKDFIREVEKDFYKDDHKEYYKKIPNDLYSTHVNVHNQVEDYYDKHRNLNHKKFISVKEKFSDYDFYENYPLIHPTSSLYSKLDNNLFLQTKRMKSPERSNNFNFNRNVIELSLKVRNNTGSTRSSLIRNKINENLRNNENESENILKNKVVDSLFSDLETRGDIPNGAINKDKVIEIFLVFKHENLGEINIPLNINRNNLVSLLKELVLEKLKEREDVFFQSLSVDNLILIMHTTLMKDSKFITDYNIKNGDKITLAVSKLEDEDEEYYNLHGAIHKHYKKGKIHFKHINKNQVAPLESLPILSKPGYKTNPDFKILCRMSLEELRNVENFTIWNKFGKIEWKEKVDLSHLDIDDIVDIDEYYINLYQGKTPKPSQGERLNKPAIFTITNIMPENEIKTKKDKEEFHQLLRNIVKEQGGEFIRYDDDNHELVFECNELK